MSIFFNYNPILSHNADINIITALRGVGKSYGAKGIVLNAFLRNKSQFIWLRRTEEQMKETKDTFLTDLLANNPEKYKKFYLVGNKCYYRETQSRIVTHKDGTEEEIEDVIKIELVGVFKTLSVGGNTRGFAADFRRIKHVIFDEFIEEDTTKYLKNELKKFSSVVMSCIRLANARVIMLSNSVSSANPYFKLFNVKITDKQINSYNIKLKDKQTGEDVILRIAFQYGADAKEYKKALINSVAGKLAILTDYAEMAINNNFILDDYTHIIEPQKMCKFDFKYNLMYDKIKVGVYQTKNHITYLYKPSNNGNTYVLNDIQEASKNDNNILINNKHFIIKCLYSQFSNGYIAFSDIHTQQWFIDLINEN